MLRDYQTLALDGLRRNLARGVKAQVLQMATGGGKTEVAFEMARSAVAKGNRFFFVVDSIELVDQAARRFMLGGLEVGIIQGQHYLTDYSKPVQVATIQTLKRRWAEMPDDIKPSVLVIDECHVFHDAHRQIVNECKHKGWAVIGLSATPFRKGLGSVFDELVVGATTADLTERGYLVPARCYAPYVPDLTGVKTSGGDWQQDALAEVVKHSRHLCDAFRARGVAADHIDGYERDEAVRDEAIRKFRSGETTVLCNVAVLTKGFDAPEISCVVLARPTKSLMLHVQMMGRGLRIAEGKADCLIFDHAGNVLRNGLPTDELPSELDDGTLDKNLDRKERDKTDPVERPCKACGHVSNKHVCPACGFKPEAREGVEVVDGVLYELDASKERGFTELYRRKLYGELLWYARDKGYKDGWAWHKVSEYCGYPPLDTRDVRPKEPCKKTQGIIRHLQIRNAKRRQAA